MRKTLNSESESPESMCHPSGLHRNTYERQKAPSVLKADIANSRTQLTDRERKKRKR